MILDLDAGNTALKWRLIGDDGDIADRGICYSFSKNLRSLTISAGIERVRVGCVAGQSANDLIGAWSTDSFGVVPEFAATKKQYSGLTIAYDDPGRLGVDRWLAMLAAFGDCGGSCCVIDCGSAITLDLVDRRGGHLGGHIVPGLRLMRSSLLNNTGNILIKEPIDSGSIELGCSTEEAVYMGTLSMAAAYIQEALSRYTEPAAQVYLTGGDADTMAPLLADSVVVDRDLVLNGLAVALP